MNNIINTEFKLEYITRDFTKEEFIEKYSQTNCPCKVGLRNISLIICENDNCKNCWALALESAIDLKFKKI